MATSAPTSAVESKKPLPKFILTVYGRMIDPTTGIVYGDEPPAAYPGTIPEGSWLACQIEAGKLVAGF